MRYLLDTCIFIHFATDQDLLSKDVYAILDDSENTLCISAETVRELVIQFNKGKLVSKYWKSADAMINSIKEDYQIDSQRRRCLKLSLVAEKITVKAICLLLIERLLSLILRILSCITLSRIRTTIIQSVSSMLSSHFLLLFHAQIHVVVHLQGLSNTYCNGKCYHK